MPATPFHFGPGLLVKAAAPRQFSMAAYSLAQVVIDIESGYYMLREATPVHRQAHTSCSVAGRIAVRADRFARRRLVRQTPRRHPRSLAAEYRLPIAV